MKERITKMKKKLFIIGLAAVLVLGLMGVVESKDKESDRGGGGIVYAENSAVLLKSHCSIKVS